MHAVGPENTVSRSAPVSLPAGPDAAESDRRPGPDAGAADARPAVRSGPSAAAAEAPVVSGRAALRQVIATAFGHRASMLGFGIAAVAYGALHAGQAVIVKWAIDAMTGAALPGPLALAAAEGRGAALAAVLALGALALVLESFAQYHRRHLQLLLSHRVTLDLRTRIAQQLLTLDLACFQRRRTGDLMSRVTTDLTEVRASLDSLAILATRPITLLAAGAAVVAIDARLAALGLVVAAPAVWTLSREYRGIRRRSKAVRDERADLASSMVQFLSAVPAVKAFGAEAQEARRFSGESERLMGLLAGAARGQSRVQPLVTLTSGLGGLAVLLLGGRWVIEGRLSVGDLVGLSAALGLVFEPARELSRAWGALEESLPAVQRAVEVLHWRPTIVEGRRRLRRFARSIRFEGVRFGYEPDHPILPGLDLELRKGKVTALVGPSGAGKSTVAALLLRFFDPDAGRVCIDGIDLRELEFASLRRLISVVGQDAVLFDCSVRENIRYGRPEASDAEVEDAARAADVHEAILGLPDGYDTVVGERGARLSGGQRQRISIARALIKDAPILILDEATSALDAQSERAVQDALDRLMAGRTSLIIAHRLSTVRAADEIVVMERGEVTGRGPHDVLMRTSATYAELVRLQSATP